MLETCNSLHVCTTIPWYIERSPDKLRQPILNRRVILRNTHLCVRPIHLPQRIANFTYSRVRSYRVEDVWHGGCTRDTPIRLSPRLLGSGSPQRLDTALHVVSRTALWRRFQSGRLLPRDALT